MMMGSTNVIITEMQLELILKQSCCNLHRANILHIVWCNLSKSQQKIWDPYRLCFEHYNSDNNCDHFDGPNPTKFNCPQCKMN